MGKLSGAIGIVCNLILAGSKLLVGMLASSMSIMADGLNNLSDAASSIVTLIGFRLAEKPADADHPYGHARYEYLSGLAVAVMIILIGFEPVSYTHLDVYKRQPLGRHAGGEDCGCRREWKVFLYGKTGADHGSISVR